MAYQNYLQGYAGLPCTTDNESDLIDYAIGVSDEREGAPLCPMWRVRERQEGLHRCSKPVPEPEKPITTNDIEF